MTNGDAPATKEDLDQAVEQLRSEMHHSYNDLVERITDSETRLLKAFYSFAETNQKRLDGFDRNDVGVKDRLSVLETRLTEVEKRLNMPRSN